MNVFRGLKRIWEDPEYKICKMLLHFVKPEHIPDRLFLKYQYHYVFGERLNLKHPKKFNEKLQWLKLYDRNPLYTTLVDKYEVKKWVTERIGGQYVIPTLAVFDNVEQIDLSKLPDRFVLKCTHDSGSVVICKGKRAFDFEAAKLILTQGLKNDFYKKHREWPYKNIKPRILAEEYKEGGASKELVDYKFYCFNGQPKIVMVASGRFSGGKTFAYFDAGWNRLYITWGAPNPEQYPEKPKNYDRMLAISRRLSKGIPHVRVDLYNVDGVIYFGELTFFDGSGMQRIDPIEWDYRMGEYIQLPS